MTIYTFEDIRAIGYALGRHRNSGAGIRCRCPVHNGKNLSLLRLPAVLQYLPVGKTTFLNKVKKGTFPKPVKISERINAWRISDINKLLVDLSGSDSTDTGTPETNTN